MKKIAIIGSGISGISIGKLLSRNFEVTIFEKSEKVGGLIKCDRIQGNLFHRVGGHVFNAKNPKVFEWFWSHFDRDKEFLKARRNAKILYNGKLIGYPLENYLYEFDKSTVEKIIIDLLEINKREEKKPNEYPNFEAFLKGNFGNTLYELYFKPYNKKIWNTDLSKVSLDWLEGKLPMPNLKQMLLSNMVREEETEMVHSSFYYAKENGSQFIIDRLATGLNIISNNEIKRIEKSGSGLKINNTELFDYVIYCGDVRKLKDTFITDEQETINVLHDVVDLKSNGTSNLFCETDNNDLSWLYLPGSEIKAHRIIYTGNFSSTNNSPSNRKTCVVEFSGKVSFEEMCEQVKKLPGNLKAISYNQEPNSYVIQDQDTRTKIQKVKMAMEPKGIFSSIPKVRCNF